MLSPSQSSETMNAKKSFIPSLAGLAAGAFLLGAKDGSPTDRPTHIAAERWFKLSDTAGIALTDELAATRQLSGSVYVRTEKGWRPVSILNPAAGQLLNERASSRR